MRNRVFSFALGNIWRWAASKNLAVLVDYMRELDISGIEITFASKEELYSFKLSEDNKTWVKNLDYVTIHAPFSLVRESEDDREFVRQLDIIQMLYRDLNAKNVIIHPNDLPVPDILDKYDFHVSTENLPHRGYSAVSVLEKLFDTYPEIGLCLDVSHAYLVSQDETGELVHAFQEKITQIHFSGTYKKNDHQSLRSVTQAFLRSIQPIKELSVPIVIEEDIENKDLNYVKEEIAYIKRIFDESK